MVYTIFAVSMIVISIPIAAISAASLSKTFKEIEEEEKKCQQTHRR